MLGRNSRNGFGSGFIPGPFYAHFDVDTTVLGWYNMGIRAAATACCGKMGTQMGRKPINADAFEILNGRVVRPGHGPKASLAALQWAADRAGQSYGTFTLGLTDEDETRIQAEYEQHQRDEGARSVEIE